MNSITRRALTLGALLLTGGLAACSEPAAPTATAPRPPVFAPAPVAAADVVTTRARIESVDASTRQILISTGTGPSNRTFQDLTAGPEVVNFNELRAGQNVMIRHTIAVAARVAPAGSAPVDGAVVAADGAARGQAPAGAAGALLVARVTFVSYNRSTNVATVIGENGNRTTVRVRNPEMQAFARRLRSGTQVDIAYAKAVAVQVTPMTASQRAGRS